ncbi:MAG: phosphoenolpyruvate carboxykinase [Candidatus Nitrospinota bacterium M3_3B_026]
MTSKTKKPYTIVRDKVILDFASLYCETPGKLLRSELFSEVVKRFLARVERKGSSSHVFIKDALPDMDMEEKTASVVGFLRLISAYSTEEVSDMAPQHNCLMADRVRMGDFVQDLYNFWRRLERFIYIESAHRTEHTESDVHHVRFIKYNEDLKNLVLYVYRRVLENLSGKIPRVYRQLPAGANMGMILEKAPWDAPEKYKPLADIPFILMTLIEPPLILYPGATKRKGGIGEIKGLDVEALRIDPAEWFCLPLKVGELTAFIYFHQDFISLGLSMSNLFEMAEYEDIKDKRPDLALVFGVKDGLGDNPTVFYDDAENEMMVGVVRGSEEMDYFGYFKKMTLTLHNVVMIKRGRLPLHGAMVYIKLKEGKSANVVMVGDSGAGKSETLEAMRSLAGEHICEMRVIFDDMGSLGVDENGRVAGYGTETGAFVRLDDLQAGYAYEQIDRSIFMNPDKTNARLIIPITTYHDIIDGYPVDLLLYANNYDLVEEGSPTIDFFSSREEALSIFRSGARLAKGTTDEKGLTHSYFANPFGAPQRKADHARAEEFYFKKMFEDGVKVGQIRTRLGVEGFEQDGPRAASMELFKIIQGL